MFCLEWGRLDNLSLTSAGLPGLGEVTRAWGGYEYAFLLGFETLFDSLCHFGYSPE